MTAVNPRLFICETCVRDQRPGADGRSRGRRLADRIQELQAERTGSSIELRVVACLSGCLNPCNVALRRRGRSGLRFSQLDAEHAEDLLALAERYATADHDAIDELAIPAALADHLSARTPPVRALVRP